MQSFDSNIKKSTYVSMATTTESIWIRKSVTLQRMNLDLKTEFTMAEPFNMHHENTAGCRGPVRPGADLSDEAPSKSGCQN